MIIDEGGNIGQPPHERATRARVARSLARMERAEGRQRAAHLAARRAQVGDDELGIEPFTIALMLAPTVLNALGPKAPPPPPPPPPCDWWSRLKRFFGVRVDYCV